MGPVETPSGTKEKLFEIVRPAADSPPGQVRVVRFELRGSHAMPRENGVGETRREPFDLRFDAGGHVFG
jgi:hypothetical protein